MTKKKIVIIFNDGMEREGWPKLAEEVGLDGIDVDAVRSLALRRSPLIVAAIGREKDGVEVQIRRRPGLGIVRTNLLCENGSDGGVLLVTKQRNTSRDD